MNSIFDAKLTYKQRKNLPASAFALPKKRKFPLVDKSGKLSIKHGRNALGRVEQEKTDVTPAEAAQVRRAVHRRFPSIGKDKKSESILACRLVDELLG